MEIALFIKHLNNYTLLNVLWGMIIIGATAGALGAFALLRGQSLLGDAISHASLPGIAIAFLLTSSRNPAILLGGGAFAGGFGSMCILAITRLTKIKKDAALGIVLSVFFGTGLMLMTYIQKYGSSNQSILNKYLFGNASTILVQDLYLMVFVAILTFLLLAMFWKECVLITFDHLFARSLGYPILVLDALLMLLMVLAIIIGLQSVGVVLMSSLLIAPAAAARQWSNRLHIMVIMAGIFGACAGVLGALIASYFSHMPTGPVVVVVLSILVLISLLFGKYLKS